MSIKRISRILGLMSVLSYILVILSVWIYSDYQGYTYFKAGEPIWWIKYPEWILGALGIYTIIDLIIENIKYDIINLKYFFTKLNYKRSYEILFYKM